MDSQFKNACLRYMGMVDLNPDSVTYGCADRSYWHYLDSKGFNVGSFQVGLLGLKIAGAVFKDPGFDRASDAALNFYCNEIQKKGLIDEYFPHQKSFCATAYTTMAASLSLEISRRLGEPKNTSAENAISKAFAELEFDTQRPESANQSLAAHLAHDLSVYNLKLNFSANPFVIPMLAKNLYLSEYGGIDLGYILKCLDICVYGCLLVENEAAQKFYLEHMQKILGILPQLAHFGFHPSLGSRGNPHRIVAGLQILAKEFPEVAAWSQSFIDSQYIPELVSHETSDDKYFSFFHLNSLALTYLNQLFPDLKSRLKSLSVPKVMFSDFEIVDAGLKFLSDQSGSKLVLSAASGGGILWTKSGHQRQIFNGYTFKDSAGRIRIPSGKAKINVVGRDIEMIFSAVIMKQKIRFLQSFFGSSLTKSLLSLPFISGLFRSYIYKKSAKTSLHQPYFKLIIKRQNNSFNFTSNRLIEITDEKPSQGWIFTDGHSTRLHGKSNLFFDPASNKFQF